MRVSYSFPSLLISAVAIVLSVAAVLYWYFQDPRVNGLKNYDFSTPEKAVLSGYEMMLKRDLFAINELQHENDAERYGEYLKSFKTEKEMDDRGKIIIFVSFLRKGVRVYKTETFEKNARSGLWFRTRGGDLIQEELSFRTVGERISGANAGDAKDDRTELEKRKDKWRTRGEL